MKFFQSYIIITYFIVIAIKIISFNIQILIFMNLNIIFISNTNLNIYQFKVAFFNIIKLIIKIFYHAKILIIIKTSYNYFIFTTITTIVITNLLWIIPILSIFSIISQT